MRGAIIAGLALALAGCVSTQMKSLVGEPIQSAQLEYGPPAQVLEMPDGRRAYQFRYGGGPVVLPGSSTTTVTTVGNTAFAQSYGTPGAVVQTDGCLLTFFASPNGNAWIIDGIKVPRDLVC